MTTGYKIEAGEDMTGHGWVKAYTWLYIVKVKDEWILSEYDYDAGTYACENCNSNLFMWLVPQSQGVYLACTGCKEVDGPLTKDGAYKVSVKTITPEVALEILKARGVKMHPFEMPAGLLKDIKKRRARIFRKKGKHTRPKKRG